MFVVVGTPPVMEAKLITRVGSHEWASEGLFETELPPLQGVPNPQGFVF
jgi:protein-L-isoaspartate(D-aspartate) O-methyltransferase